MSELWVEVLKDASTSLVDRRCLWFESGRMILLPNADIFSLIKINPGMIIQFIKGGKTILLSPSLVDGKIIPQIPYVIIERRGTSWYKSYPTNDEFCQEDNWASWIIKNDVDSLVDGRGKDPLPITVNGHGGIIILPS